MLFEVLALAAVAAFAFYKWLTANFKFFEERNVPFIKPYPLVGSQYNLLFKKLSFLDFIVDMYNQHETKFFGVFESRTPVYVIKDPEIIRQVTVKEFDHFVNHRSTFTDINEGLFGSTVFAMKNQKWKDMRTTLSPAFTGSKMRLMYQLINDVAVQAIDHLKKKNTAVELDMKEYMTRFTNDVIASTAFGIKVDSLNDKDNEFFAMGKSLTNFTAGQNFKMLLIMNFKMLSKLFNEKDIKYFTRLVVDAMDYREKHGIVRPDVINMLMEATGRIKSDDPSKDTKPVREWTEEEIVAQCFGFFFAGFDTSSMLMCFAAHEIMENPDVQEKLVAEIDEVVENLNGEPVTYEILQKMKYLDAVLSETLRKWPPAVFMDRVCTKSLTIEDKENNLNAEIRVGDSIWIPAVGLHRDEKYFPNPKVFDPERFSDENKSKIHPATYIPFGIGPRICIASRFALLESKAMLFHLLRNFRLEPAAKSIIPLELEPAGFQLRPKDGFWLKLAPRT